MRGEEGLEGGKIVLESFEVVRTVVLVCYYKHSKIAIFP